MTALFSLIVIGGLMGPPAGPPPSLAARADTTAVTLRAMPAAHDFHVSYGRMVIEGNKAVCRIRFFKNDLEAALQAHHQDATLKVAASPRVEALFLSYFHEHFVLQQATQVLQGVIVSSGEEEAGSETMWWYLLQFESETALDQVRLRNTVLFNAFDDQKNIFKVMLAPDEAVKTYYYADGAEEYALGR